MNVYIKTQGTRIVKDGKHLQVKKADSVYNTLFTYKLNQLVLFGNIEITHPALCQLMRNKVDVVYLTRYGRYLGRIASPESKNVFLHKQQYKLVDNADFCIKLSRDIVAGKLSNMATLLMRIKRSRKKPEAGAKAREIQSLMGKLEQVNNVDSIRGYEGKGSALYFKGFQNGFIEDAGFTKRVRRPPTDPVNSVLSLLYTLLMNRVYAAVRVAGLDPYPGFLHSIDYGRYSLVLDLMEEFRTIIVDTLTLSMFNLKILKLEDFKKEVPPEIAFSNNSKTNSISEVINDPMGLISTPDCSQETFDIPEQRIVDSPSSEQQLTGKYPVHLVSDAFKQVLEAFEKKLTTEFFYPPAQRELSYSDAFIYQAKQYRKVIEGELETYQPVLLK